MKYTGRVVGLVALVLAIGALVAWICVLAGRQPAWAAVPLGAIALWSTLRWLLLRFQARRAAAGLEAGIVEQAAEAVKNARPDLEPELKAQADEIARALADLPQGALSTRPWYALIGPPGSGKTALLNNAGLSFASERTHVAGLGGLRGCELWLANAAFVLDGGGRWIEQEDDHPAWLGFLQLLRRYRSAKPLNGLIAAISIREIANAEPKELDALADQLRIRFEELAHALQASAPCYIVFTQCDAIEGFRELFSGLRPAEREHIFGFTLPLARANEPPAAAFGAEYDVLTAALRGDALARMGEERSPHTRQVMCAFPEQFAAMAPKLASFVEQVFESKLYRELLPLRGAYFTSSTQAGQPFNLLFPPDTEAAAELSEPKSYFVQGLFSRVIFADAALASASRSDLKRARSTRRLATGVLALAGLLFGLAPSALLLHSRYQLALARKHFSAADSGGSVAPAKPELGEPERAFMADIARYERGVPEPMSKLGLYTGERALPALRQQASSLLRRQLAEPLVRADLELMRDFATRYESVPRAAPARKEHDAVYAALKLHLLLTNPGFAAPYTEWMQTELARRWQELGPQAEPLAKAYAAYTQSYPELAFTQDSALVRRVRSVLSRASSAQETLETIVARVSAQGLDLDLEALTGAAKAFEGGQRRVRGAFTRRGYESTVRELFATGAPEHADEPWVLGTREERGGAERDARLAELSALYFRAYIAEWRGFLAGLRTQAPPSVGAEALALLNQLSMSDGVITAAAAGPAPQAPQLPASGTALGRLFQSVADNTRLPGAQPSAAGGDVLTGIARRDKRSPKRKPAPANEHTGPAELAQAFTPFVNFGVPAEAVGGKRAPYDTYRELLAGLREALQLRLEQPSESQQLDKRVDAALPRVKSLIDAQPPALRSQLEALLWPPIRGLRAVTFRDGAALGQKWCKDVVAPFERTLLEHYPLAAESPDAKPQDFDAFYKPNTGALWKFVGANLNEQVELSGDEFVFSSKYEHGGGLYNAELVEFLNRGSAITRAFYNDHSKVPRVDFSVRVHAAADGGDKASFSLGGKQISSGADGLSWHALSWPGPTPARGASVSVHGESDSSPGVWGLFHLLERGIAARTADDAISVTWPLPGERAVWIDLRPESSVSPFFDLLDHGSPRLLALLRSPSALAPHRIALGQPACSQ